VNRLAVSEIQSDRAIDEGVGLASSVDHTGERGRPRPGQINRDAWRIGVGGVIELAGLSGLIRDQLDHAEELDRSVDGIGDILKLLADIAKRGAAGGDLLRAVVGRHHFCIELLNLTDQRAVGVELPPILSRSLSLRSFDTS
jgi:hypothetical protein